MNNAWLSVPVGEVGTDAGCIPPGATIVVAFHRGSAVDDEDRIGIVPGGGRTDVAKGRALHGRIGEEEALLENALLTYRLKRPFYELGVRTDPVTFRRASWLGKSLCLK